MKHVTLGRIAVILALAVVAISLVFGDYDRAESDLRKFYAQVAKAEFRQARQTIDEAIGLWPANARYYGWRGYVASQELPSQCPAHRAAIDAQMLEQVRTAARDYRYALELNSRDAVAHHNLAWLDHLMGRDQEARREFERAVAIDPETAIYHLSLGVFLDEGGDAAAADFQYVAAIERTPAILDSPFFMRLRGRYRERVESIVDQAITRTERRLGNTNDPILKARLGKFYLYGRDLQRAGELLEGASKDLPNLPLVWFNLGEVRRLQGRRDEAWACYGKAKFLDGSLAGPWLRIAEMYREAGQRNPAIENFRAAAQKWAHVNPVTAAHNNRLYGGPPQIIDDLLPTTLVWYASPCEASASYGALAEFMPDNKLYASRSRTCENLPSPHSGMAQ
jgi:tetratricopeptide (TPR) repeat protein